MEILEPTGELQDPIRLYPWDIWLVNDGKPRVIDQEYDFPTTDIDNMRIYLYTNAKNRDVKVKTSIVENRYIVFQCYADTDNPPRLPNFVPTSGKPKCRHCGKALTNYSLPFGECRKEGQPNKRSCK